MELLSYSFLIVRSGIRWNKNPFWDALREQTCGGRKNGIKKELERLSMGNIWENGRNEDRNKKRMC
jgi:hypothetical protein